VVTLTPPSSTATSGWR